MPVIVTQGFLDRTVRIKYGNSVGSAIYIQISEIRMLLTAAHIVAGMQEGDNLGVRFEDDWQMKRVVGVARGAMDTDVAAIRLETHWGDGLGEAQLNGQMSLGGDVAYCGFPLNLEMRGLPGALGWPKGFVKAATFSGKVERPQGGSDFYFDTINNAGFSGGPILTGTAPNLSVIAVVSGYKFDATAPVYSRAPDGSMTPTADYVVRPNSGFMIGVPIVYATDAAKTLLPAR